MTSASSPAPARVHPQPALNYAAIRARAAELGMLETTLNELTGVTLGTLERDPDQRGIGLPLLTRLATVLDLPLDDLVVTGEPAPHPVHPARAGDDVILLALLACYSGLATQRVLDLLGWTHQRLDTALATNGAHLAPTALRVAATDHRLTLTLRPGALPALLRERFDAEQSLRRPLDPSAAVQLLELVRDKILAPFPSEDEHPTRVHSLTADFLVGSGIAIVAADPGGDPDTAVVEIHPDVMFALRLTDRPADAPGP